MTQTVYNYIGELHDFCLMENEKGRYLLPCEGKEAMTKKPQDEEIQINILWTAILHVHL